MDATGWSGAVWYAVFTSISVVTIMCVWQEVTVDDGALQSSAARLLLMTNILLELDDQCRLGDKGSDEGVPRHLEPSYLLTAHSARPNPKLVRPDLCGSWILDPSAAAFLQQVDAQHTQRAVVKIESASSFSIVHYAGKVTYSTEGFVGKNTDKVEGEMLELMESCQCLVDLFALPTAESTATAKGSATQATTGEAVTRPTAEGVMPKLNIAAAQSLSAADKEAARTARNTARTDRDAVEKLQREAAANTVNAKQDLDKASRIVAIMSSITSYPAETLQQAQAFVQVCEQRLSQATAQQAVADGKLGTAREALREKEDQLADAEGRKKGATPRDTGTPRDGGAGKSNTLGARLRVGIGEVSSSGKAPSEGLMGLLRQTSLHYVRCVKPNDSRAPFGFEQAQPPSLLNPPRLAHPAPSHPLPPCRPFPSWAHPIPPCYIQSRPATSLPILIAPQSHPKRTPIASQYHPNRIPIPPQFHPNLIPIQSESHP